MSDPTLAAGLNYAEFDKMRHTLNRTSGRSGTAGATVPVEGRKVRTFYAHTPAHRLCGMSSDAMTSYAYGVGPRPRTPGTPSGQHSGAWSGDECGRNYPYDTDDLGACHETVRLAQALNATGIPAMRIADDVMERMVTVFVEFWLWVVAGVNRHGVHIAHTQWHPLPSPAVAEVAR